MSETLQHQSLLLVHSQYLYQTTNNGSLMLRGKIGFILPVDTVTRNLTIACKGKLDFLPFMAIQVPNADACTQGVTCPTTPGTRYTIQSSLPISRRFPVVSS